MPARVGGKVEAWLEIDEKRFERVTATPENVLSSALANPQSPRDFATGRVGWPIEPTVEWSGAPLEAAPQEVQALLRDHPELHLTLENHSDHLDQLVVQQFASEITTVRYRLAGREGEIDVPAWASQAMPSDEAGKPLKRRLQVLAATAVGAFFASVMLAFWYTGRHAFFAETINAKWLALLAVVLPILVLPAVAMLVLTRSARPRFWQLALVPTALAMVAQLILASTGGPTVTHAQQLVAVGNVAEAKQEAKASFNMGVDAAESGTLHDDLQLAELRAIDEPGAAWEAVASVELLTEEGRFQAEAHALAVAATVGRELQAAGDLAESLVLLKGVPKSLQQTETLRPLWRSLREDQTRTLWGATSVSNTTLTDRLNACKSLDKPLNVPRRLF